MTTKLAVTLMTAAALLGCGKSKSDKPSGDKMVEKDKGEAKKAPLAADFFGKAPAPLGALTKLKWGMTDPEARAAAPELFPKPDKDFQLADDPKLDGVTYGIGFNKDTHKLDRMYVQLSPANAKLVETAWGKGKPAKDSIGRERTYWFEPNAGWRAYLEKGFGDDMNLELHPYLPAAKLLGDDPKTLGFAPQGILGATVDDMRARFKDTLVETSEAKAKEEQKKVGNFVGKDLEKDLGPANANVRIELPPTEWEEFWTRVETFWGDDHKVESTWFKLPYEAYPAAKDEIKALLDKKWGAPKIEKEFGTAGDDILVYHAKAPRIYVKDDTITHGWDVHLTTKKD